VKLSPETIRDVLTWHVEDCNSNGKSIVVLWPIDRILDKDGVEEPLVPLYEGLLLHQDSVEFVDSNGTLTVLPFSRIARIEIDIEDAEPASPTPRPKNKIGGSRLCNFVRSSKTEIEDRSRGG
jgi:hypothetical protein